MFSIQLPIVIELPELEKPIPEKNKEIKEWKDGFERKENWVLTTSKTQKEWNESKTQKISYIVQQLMNIHLFCLFVYFIYFNSWFETMLYWK